MLNEEQFLNSKIFDRDVEMEGIRKGFGEGLLKAGEQNEKVVGLCADLTESTHMSLFKEKFPDRFIQVGVAEQNLATVASGMAHMGKIPFITSYSMFSPGRNWEQIRTTICYNDVPVKIAGSHAGISVGPDGGTHQAIEDIALMRVLPRMVVLSPCDYLEAKKATTEASKTNTPVYIRLAREKTPVITTEKTPFQIGKAQIIFGAKEKPDVSVFATGALLYKALIAAKLLWEQGIVVQVINISTIKPLDEETILKSTSYSNAVVTVEEHQIAGGMGSAIAELLAEKMPVPIEFVGINDEYGQSGKPDDLLTHYNLDEKAIRKAIEKVLLRKNII